MRHALRPAEGLSDAAWTPLVHLHRLGDGISQTDMAAAEGLDGSSLVRLPDMLVAQGLIERQAHAMLQSFDHIEARIAAMAGRL
ncbi:MAG: MarR family transcriptional regulator [Proteobacteria bacterium]|nr:MarR family transcriptional regulator [Pseudomonadota bacterium]MBS0493442.1 MarR family transcriptional regulator [Pseudomonadota bacterium]